MNAVSRVFSIASRFLALSACATLALRAAHADTITRPLVTTAFSGDISSVAFSPDGARTLTGSWDGTAKLWNAETGALIRTFSVNDYEILSVAYSPDGTRVLTGSTDRTAELWDAETGALIRKLFGHSDYVTSVAFSPDGSRVLTGSNDGTAKLWDAETGAEIWAFSGHDDFVW